MALELATDKSTVARMTLVAIALGAAAVATAAGGLYWPEPSAGGETYSYADIASYRGLWWGLLGALAVVAIINVPLQAVATMFLVQARGSVWATVGGSLMWGGIALGRQVSQAGHRRTTTRPITHSPPPSAVPSWRRRTTTKATSSGS